MLIKTYPTPSSSYGELVCTAGIRLRDGAWVRIYPYPFRQLSKDLRFSKGDIVELPLQKASGDPRLESYKIYDTAAIKKVGELGTERGWAERMHYIRPTVVASVSEFKAAMFPSDGHWGPSIRPVAVQSGSASLSWKGQEPWSAEDLAKLRRAESDVKGNLFVDDDVAQYFKVLQRVPYEFRLKYLDKMGEEHQHLILDWEIAQLYFNVRQNEASDEAALEKVRQKIEDEIFGKRNDVFLVLGNVHHRFRNANAIVINGFIYPRQQLQPGLFEDSGAPFPHCG